MLVTRSVNNVGDPICSPSGQPLKGVVVTFGLVGADGKATDVWDAISHERIPGNVVTAITNVNGEFRIQLWPNDRGSDVTYYLCSVNAPTSMKTFKAALPSGSGPILWADFLNMSTPLTPAELDLLNLVAVQVVADRDLVAADKAIVIAATAEVAANAVTVHNETVQTTANTATAVAAANAANLSEIAANLSKVSAISSASSASGSAGTATTKANEANASAIAAAASAVTASAAVTPATTAATNASNSATTAQEMAQLTASDRLATETSAANADLDRVAAQTAAATATNAANAAANDAVATAADRVQTGLDRSQTTADRAVTTSDRGIVAADKLIVATNTTTASNAANTAAADKVIVAADKEIVAANKAIIESITATLSSVNGGSTRTLSVAEVSSTILDDVSLVAPVDLQLPAAAAGLNFMMVCGCVCTHQWRIKAGAGDKIYLNGVAGIDAAYVGITTHAIGNYISVFSFKTGPASWDWMAVVGLGNWVVS